MVGSSGQTYIAAGGDGGFGYTFDSYTLDLETLTWGFGPNLPRALAEPASVPYGDSFLVTGGKTSSGRLDTIYEYDWQGEDWIERPEKLPSARTGHVGVMVSPDYLGCQ